MTDLSANTSSKIPYPVPFEDDTEPDKLSVDDTEMDGLLKQVFDDYNSGVFEKERIEEMAMRKEAQKRIEAAEIKLKNSEKMWKGMNDKSELISQAFSMMLSMVLFFINIKNKNYLQDGVYRWVWFRVPIILFYAVLLPSFLVLCCVRVYCKYLGKGTSVNPHFQLKYKLKILCKLKTPIISLCFLTEDSKVTYALSCSFFIIDSFVESWNKDKSCKWSYAFCFTFSKYFYILNCISSGNSGYGVDKNSYYSTIYCIFPFIYSLGKNKVNSITIGLLFVVWSSLNNERIIGGIFTEGGDPGQAFNIILLWNSGAILSFIAFYQGDCSALKFIAKVIISFFIDQKFCDPLRRKLIKTRSFFTELDIGIQSNFPDLNIEFNDSGLYRSEQEGGLIYLEVKKRSKNLFDIVTRNKFDTINLKGVEKNVCNLVVYCFNNKTGIVGSITDIGACYLAHSISAKAYKRKINNLKFCTLDKEVIIGAWEIVVNQSSAIPFCLTIKNVKGLKEKFYKLICFCFVITGKVSPDLCTMLFSNLNERSIRDLFGNKKSKFIVAGYKSIMGLKTRFNMPLKYIALLSKLEHLRITYSDQIDSSYIVKPDGAEEEFSSENLISISHENETNVNDEAGLKEKGGKTQVEVKPPNLVKEEPLYVTDEVKSAIECVILKIKHGFSTPPDDEMKKLKARVNNAIKLKRKQFIWGDSASEVNCGDFYCKEMDNYKRAFKILSYNIKVKEYIQNLELKGEPGYLTFDEQEKLLKLYADICNFMVSALIPNVKEPSYLNSMINATHKKPKAREKDFLNNYNYFYSVCFGEELEEQLKGIVPMFESVRTIKLGDVTKPLISNFGLRCAEVYARGKANFNEEGLVFKEVIDLCPRGESSRSEDKRIGRDSMTDNDIQVGFNSEQLKSELKQKRIKESVFFSKKKKKDGPGNSLMFVRGVKGNNSNAIYIAGDSIKYNQHNQKKLNRYKNLLKKELNLKILMHYTKCTLNLNKGQPYLDSTIVKNNTKQRAGKYTDLFSKPFKILKKDIKAEMKPKVIVKDEKKEKRKVNKNKQAEIVECLYRFASSIILYANMD